MAHGHNDTCLSWEWDSVLLLSNPCALASPSLEADRSSSGGTRERFGSVPASSLDHARYRHYTTLHSNGTSNLVHVDSRSSETQSLDSKGDQRRDPKLECPNFLAGRVPCACTDNDDDDGGVSRKRSKPIPRCQVAACGAELTDLKGYHQRHRVCLRCAHATRVILRDQPHRYCQQCGKFHPICDFDEGKRSCRRKLEKHNNRRRRKAGDDCVPALDYGDTFTHNESSPGDGIKVDVVSKCEMKGSLGEKQSLDVEDTLQRPRVSSNKMSCVILKEPETSALTGMSTDVSSQILEFGVATSVKENLPNAEQALKIAEVSQHLERRFPQVQPSPLAVQGPMTSDSHQTTIQALCSDGFSLHSSPRSETGVRRGNDEQSLLALLMDENGAESSEFSENDGQHLIPSSTQFWESSTSPGRPNTEMAFSSQLPTGRISFKLYDWNPGDFPRDLRQQIMEWLSNMPVDLEGYIRSGCTILTIFIAMPQSVWDELKADWEHSVLKLVKAEQSLSRFWSSGYLIARMDDHEVHIYNGGLANPFSKTISKSPLLYRVRPLCLEAGSKEEIMILGHNLQQPQSRLLISFDGKYVVKDAYQSFMEGKMDDSLTRVHDGGDGEDASLFVSMPPIPSESSGTAYIEVENLSGTSNYIPLLVAGKSIVDEVRSLEKEMEMPTSCCLANKNVSPGFPLLSRKTVHGLLIDLGWVLKKVYPKNFESDSRIEILELHFKRLQRLLLFGVERNWYNVVEKVLQLSSKAGFLEKIGVLENGLSVLQVAVLYHKQGMVEQLISCAESLCASRSQDKFWWNLGFPGPKGLTILHIVALRPDAQGLYDMLLKKKGVCSMGNHIHDLWGQTPEEYFRSGEILSHRIKVNDFIIHTGGNLREQNFSVICLDGHIEDRFSLRLKEETRISFPSLPYYPGPWKFTQRATVGCSWWRRPVWVHFFSHQGLTLYYSSSRKRSYQLESSVTILLVCGTLCHSADM